MRRFGFAVSVGLLLSMASMAKAQTPVIIPSGPPGPGRVTKSAERPQGVVAPVPALLTAGRKVFLSNGGAEAGLFPHPFTGTQDRGYGRLYTALGGTPRFELVGSPADADLVMELRLAAPSGSLGGDKKKGTEDALPAFTLTIYDRATHYVLWTISQTIDQANLQKTHDKNFDDALDLLVKQLLMVANGSATPPPLNPRYEQCKSRVP
jgi:hypothetical protein